MSRLRSIIKFRGDTQKEVFLCDESYHTLRFVLRNKDGIPLLALNNEDNPAYLFSNSGEGLLLLCHPSVDSMLLDTSVFVEPGGTRELFYGIEGVSNDERRILLRGKYILMDDVVTGGVFEGFPPPSRSFEGLPYAILRALTYAALVGVSAAALPPDQIRSAEDTKRAEIAATIQRLKEQGILPVTQEFESIRLTPEALANQAVSLSYPARSETINIAVAGTPHAERGIDFIISNNQVIEFTSDFAQALNTLPQNSILEASYLTM